MNLGSASGSRSAPNWICSSVTWTASFHRVSCNPASSSLKKKNDAYWQTITFLVELTILISIAGQADDDTDDFSVRQESLGAQGSVETRPPHNDSIVGLLKRACCGPMPSSLEMAMWLHDRRSSVSFSQLLVACCCDAFTVPCKRWISKWRSVSALVQSIHSFLGEITLLLHRGHVLTAESWG